MSVELTIKLPNRAGQLGALAGALGDAGISMRSIAATTGGGAGTVYIVVDDKDAAKARRAIKAKKYRISGDRKIVEVRAREQTGHARPGRESPRQEQGQHRVRVHARLVQEEHDARARREGRTRREEGTRPPLILSTGTPVPAERTIAKRKHRSEPRSIHEGGSYRCFVVSTPRARDSPRSSTSSEPRSCWERSSSA